MSAPPIGMIRSAPSTSAMIDDQPEVERAARDHETDDEEHQRQPERDVDDVTRRQDDRRAAHAARQFQERDHRAGKGQRADGDAERHFDQALGMDVSGRADVEGFGRVERPGGDQHRGHADQRVERGDQFRHRGHRHPARDHSTDAAAYGDTENDQDPGHAVRRRMTGKRGRHRDAPCRSCRRSCPDGTTQDWTARAAP